MKEEPLWYFGYGLGYTSVSYGKPKYDGWNITVALTNKGKRPTTETVQVYINRPDDSEGPAAFEWWDSASNTMRVFPGAYNVMVGPSAGPKTLRTLGVRG